VGKGDAETSERLDEGQISRATANKVIKVGTGDAALSEGVDADDISAHEQAGSVTCVVGIRVDSVVFQLAAAIERCYDAFFNSPLLPSANPHGAGPEGEGDGAGDGGSDEALVDQKSNAENPHDRLQEALLKLCLSVNDDLACFQVEAVAEAVTEAATEAVTEAVTEVRGLTT
jgi:hypothetical protein